MEITKIVVKERGATPRGLKRAYNNASKNAWAQAGLYFHVTYRPRRFTEAHGKEAGYKPRDGESLPFGSVDFWKSYTGKKWKKYHHRHPLEYSGATKSAANVATIASTSKGARVKYPRVRVFNFRPYMQEEFRRILPAEARHIGRIYDRNLDRLLAADTTVETRQID